MSWIDKVASAPAVGLEFEAWFRSRDGLVEALNPLFAELDQAGEGLMFQDLGPMALRVELSRGLRLTVDLKSIIVSATQSEAAFGAEGTHAEALGEACGIAAQMAELLFKNEYRGLRRAGFVADCRVPSEAPPPGVEAWLAALARPWGERELELVDGQFAVELASGENYRDRCHHRLGWEKSLTDQFGVRLDWQRLYDPADGLRGKDVGARLETLSALALMYLEQFGAGEVLA